MKKKNFIQKCSLLLIVLPFLFVRGCPPKGDSKIKIEKIELGSFKFKTGTNKIVDANEIAGVYELNKANPELTFTATVTTDKEIKEGGTLPTIEVNPTKGKEGTDFKLTKGDVKKKDEKTFTAKYTLTAVKELNDGEIKFEAKLGKSEDKSKSSEGSEKKEATLKFKING